MAYLKINGTDTQCFLVLLLHAYYSWSGHQMALDRKPRRIIPPPKVQTSTSGPVYTLPANNSGAAKYKEPQNVDNWDLAENIFDKPKLIILIFPVLDIKIFSTFRSVHRRIN
jgi:hypothetical protein